MGTPEARAGMHRGNQLVFTLAKRAPIVLRALFGVAAFAAKRWPDKVAGQNSKQLPAADREILRDEDLFAALRDGMPESYRQGARAVADEARLFCEPWGFRLEEITVPVLLWHGSEDRNAPIAIGGLYIDPGPHSAVLNNQPLPLTRQEFDLLLALAREDAGVAPDSG